MNKPKSILITGAAGFIGSHLVRRLRSDYNLFPIDRLTNLEAKKRVEKSPVCIRQADIHGSFWPLDNQIDMVIHLAAETGVSESDRYQERYFHQNVTGTQRVLDTCLEYGVKHLIYASSSSVYSPGQSKMDETANTENPISYYGKTKKMAENRVQESCQKQHLSAYGLRFFTVYGSQVRSDMAAYKFMSRIQKNEPVTLYNNGEVERDFTHVSDVIESIARLIPILFSQEVGQHEVFNIGRGKPLPVKTYANTIAKAMNMSLAFQSAPLPDNELQKTHSVCDKLERHIQFKPQTNLETGAEEMAMWFLENQA